MSSSRLRAITISNFKSIYVETRVEFGALTAFVGKNNSGKSTINQVLLLLKQTLELARVESPLHLDGYVSAINLRELISGWPSPSEDRIEGPKFSLEWSSVVDVAAALEVSGKPDISTLMERASLPWLASVKEEAIELYTRMDLEYSDLKGKVVLDRVRLRSSLTPDFQAENPLNANVLIERDRDGRYECRWGGQVRKQLEVAFHHFIPSLSINRRNVGPRDTQRSLANAYNVLFAQPLDGLEAILKGFSFLSSTRGLPPLFYPPASTDVDHLGVSGEFAAQLLYAHQSEPVHYLLPDFDDINKPLTFREQSLSIAINEVLSGLGIDTPLSIHEIETVGFRLLFGSATLFHVGRGLTYLLPIVQLGLFSDPRRFQTVEADADADIYANADVRLCAFEEPESHLHPKVQSRLANWLVALAQAHRQVIVETHSDHLVRRLRALMAQSSPGSAIETWLSENVRIISVNQQDGKTSIESSGIGRDGAMEIWPPDFMDVAVQAEQAIYYAALDKEEVAPGKVVIDVIHEDEDEPDAGR
ncbi:AAA family ATPase [Burkholderia sp. Se-20378]|uniref:AAA family ATPase n=1 Tax=Burkholderia sp. Se-20378 TaxID=2703899 RepID=UPI00197D16DC|nr:AAA family ATPase [Burkholderia sp. Se-20378]MBN3770709.1 AAA family ATPase [Burkholderia sp. Se-20378]